MTLAKNDVKEHTLLAWFLQSATAGPAGPLDIRYIGGALNETRLADFLIVSALEPWFFGHKTHGKGLPQKMKMRLIENDQGILLSFFGECAISKACDCTQTKKIGETK